MAVINKTCYNCKKPIKQKDVKNAVTLINDMSKTYHAKCYWALKGVDLI